MSHPHSLSNHRNDGTHTCADCGADLNAAKPVKTLTAEQYRAIHTDFRGEWSGISGTSEWIGRRTAMSGSIGLPLGFLAIEGQDFLIADERGRPFFPAIRKVEQGETTSAVTFSRSTVETDSN